MHLLSESGEVLIKTCTEHTHHSVETLVIGSGYGGSVAALRLSESGSSVYVIERGEEYVSGEFPNDMSQLGKHVRADVLTPNGVTSHGYENALFDVRAGAGIGAIVGNGLGGGSLINAGIGIIPDQRVFQQESWPAALRNENLTQYFDLAAKTLELQTAGKPHNGKPQAYDPTKTKKYQRLYELFLKATQHIQAEDKAVKITFEPLAMAVQLDADPSHHLGKRAVCNGCGDCITGCNFDAKLTLTKTYLPRAIKNGAKVFTGLTVLHVLPNTHAETKDQYPWEITFVRTSERKLSREILQSTTQLDDADSVKDPNQWQYKIKAKRVILSAGTFGSTEILLRSRNNGLKVSGTALGMKFSGNGDDVAFAFGLSKEANAIGSGAGKNPADPNQTHHVAPENSVGPTASGVIRFDDQDDIMRSSVIEDGSIPGLMRTFFGELTHTLAAIIQLNAFKFRREGNTDHLAANPNHNKHTFTLLCMGHDSANGVIALDAISDRVALAWPEVKKESSPKIHQLRQAIVKKLGAIFIKNPAAGIIPDSIAHMLSGPARETNMITVHPLGGCRMSDNVYTGVVNDWGAVFHDDGSASDKIYDGLFVLDGSIIPSAVGVNPFLTITALAERACKMICLGFEKTEPQPVELKTLNPETAPRPLYDDQLGEGTAKTRLCEVLRCKNVHIAPQLAASIGVSETMDYPAALFVEMQVDDWNTVLTHPQHEVKVIPTHAAGQRLTRSRLVFDTIRWETGDTEGNHGKSIEFEVKSGTVRLYTQRKDGCLVKINSFIRAGGTYFLSRLMPDSSKDKNLAAKKQRKRTSKNLWGKIINGVKLLCHASEVREFHYHLTVTFHHQEYTLTGHKLIEYAATYGALFQALKTLCNTGKFPVIQRKSVWEQLTQLSLVLKEPSSQKTLFDARFDMDIPEVLRRFIPQLGAEKDTLNALFALASYPLLLLRGIIKTRLLDFRLPDYLDQIDETLLPYKDPALITKPAGYRQLANLPDKYRFPSLQTRTKGKIHPNAPISLMVDFSSDSDEKIEIGLIRYPQVTSVIPTDNGMYKSKSIVLLNGLALTTHAFVAEELQTNNLAAMLYDAGWDVWLLEYRASPMLDASAKYTALDDIAAFDIPAAIQHVIETVSQEQQTSGHPTITTDNTQLYCLSHCVGSASLTMSMLAGKLRHQNGQSKLAGVLISQFQPYLVGSQTTQMRLQLASFMRNVLGRDMLNFTSGQAKADGLHAVMDRIFASFSYHPDNTFSNETCPHEQDLSVHQTDSTSCKRMTGIFGRSMVHDNLLLETHEKLDLYFGRANVGAFLHGAKCVELECLVDMDGQNVYVDDEKVRKFLDMPVMLLHGEKNVLFNQASFYASKKQLERIFGTRRNQQQMDAYLLVPGYAHFDCTIGKDAHEKIFTPAIQFFDRAHEKTLKPSPNTAYTYHPRLPLVGPMFGWINETPDTLKVRVWIEVDNAGAGIADKTVAITRASYGNTVKHQVWKVCHQNIRSRKDAKLGSPDMHVARISFAIAEIEIPNAEIHDLKVEMFSLHEMLAKTDSHTDLPDFIKSIQQLPPENIDNKFARIDLGEVAPILTLTTNDTHAIDEMFKAYLDQLDKQRERAFSADPNTLSRRIRDIKSGENCSASLRKAQRISEKNTLTFLAAGCRHPGLTGFEEDRSDITLNALSTSIHQVNPQFMVMLGDQIYSDSRAGLLDKSTLIERIIPKYRHAFGSAGFRSVANKLPLYMVMDDHEIHDNWSTEYSHISDIENVITKNARSAFFIYQRSHGPQPLVKDSFDYCFSKSGFEFISIDTRSNKSRVPARGILHDRQWEALEKWLKSQDKHQPKFILTSSVVFPGLQENDSTPSPRRADNWQMSVEERDRLMTLIATNEIHNVIFITSDYHCSAVSEISLSNNVRAYSIVAPALHAPLRFANVRSDTVLRNETFQCGTSTTANVKSQAWDGEGWLKISINQDHLAGMYALDLSFYLREFNEDQFNMKNVKWCLTATGGN